jgi:hypothetical protein
MKRNKIKFVIFTFFLFCCTGLFAQKKDGGQKTIYTESQQKLRITRADIRIIHEKNPELGGFHLYVRKIDGVESILLTETAKDPGGKQDSYAYRAKEYNSINGDEIRLLDGKVLVSEGAKYSLVDSSVEETSFFGPAFHIYIPPVIVYGYEWSRNGEVEIGEGTFVNIRSFEKLYADYSGNFMDSPFMFNFVVKKKPEEAKLTDQYNPLASDAFKEISGDIIYSKGPESLIDDISEVFDKLGNTDDMDLIFVIDATGSMKDDMERLKTDLVPLVEKKLGEYPLARIGLLFYRDYGDTFKFMNLPVRYFDFTSDLKIFQKNLNSVKIMGKEGGDVPEAVYEAIFAASEFYKWGNESNRQIILIGDAQPHPLPRGSGKYSKEFVMEKAAQKNVKIHSILLPSD